MSSEVTHRFAAEQLARLKFLPKAGGAPTYYASSGDLSSGYDECEFRGEDAAGVQYRRVVQLLAVCTGSRGMQASGSPWDVKVYAGWPSVRAKSASGRFNVDVVACEDTPIPHSLQAVATPSLREALDRIQRVFQLPLVDIAWLLNVKRQTVHGWKADPYAPIQRENSALLAALLAAADAWSSATSNPAPRWLLSTPIRGRGLREWLNEAVEMRADIGKLMRQVATELTAGDQRARHGAPQAPVRPWGASAFQEFASTLVATKADAAKAGTKRQGTKPTVRAPAKKGR